MTLAWLIPLGQPRKRGTVVTGSITTTKVTRP
jgi:hypothetical protein